MVGLRLTFIKINHIFPVKKQLIEVNGKSVSLTSNSKTKTIFPRLISLQERLVSSSCLKSSKKVW